MPLDVAAVEALAVAAAGVFSDGFQELATNAVQEVNAEQTRLAEEGQRLEEVRAHIGDLLEQLAVERQSFEDEKRRQTAEHQCDTEKGNVVSVLKGASPRMPLDKLHVGAVITGKVSRCGTNNLFVDIGAVLDAQLRLPKADIKKFRKGDFLDCLVIVSIDWMKQEVRLRFQRDIDAAVVDTLGSSRNQPTESSPPPLLDREAAAVVAAAADRSKEVTSAIVGRGRGGEEFKKRLLLHHSRSTKLSTGVMPTLCEEDLVQNHNNHSAKPLGGQMNTHTSCVSLEELKIGNTVSGIVVSTGLSGVFLDFGATKPGRLKAAKNEAKRLQVGDYVQAVIEGLDLDKGHFVVSLVPPSHPQAPRAWPAGVQAAAGTPPTRLAAGQQAGGLGDMPCWEPTLAAATAPTAAANGGEVIDDGKGAPPTARKSTAKPKSIRASSLSPQRSINQVGGEMTAKQPRGHTLPGTGMNARRRCPSRSPHREQRKDEDAATRRRVRRHGSPSPAPDAVAEGATSRGKPVELTQSKTAKVQKSRGAQEVVHLEDLSVGDALSGIVSSCDASGVWIDFGGTTDGLLRTSEDEANMFQPGDHLQGVLVEEILVNEQRLFLRHPND